MQGVEQAKNNEFSLSSGDFPTLGSEKDKSVKNSELQGSIVSINSIIKLSIENSAVIYALYFYL